MKEKATISGIGKSARRGKYPKSEVEYHRTYPEAAAKRKSGKVSMEETYDYLDKTDNDVKNEKKKSNEEASRRMKVAERILKPKPKKEHKQAYEKPTLKAREKSESKHKRKEY